MNTNDIKYIPINLDKQEPFHFITPKNKKTQLIPPCNSSVGTSLFTTEDTEPHGSIGSLNDENMYTLKIAQPLPSNYDEEGYFDIHMCVIHWNVEELDILLARGDDINHRTLRQQLTPLMLAVQENNVEAVKELIGRNAEMSNSDINYNTCLHKASASGNVDILSILIDSGADINVQNKNGTTPLISAAKNVQPQALDFLLSKAPSIELHDHGGYTALCYAAWRGFGVEPLLKHNADVNLKSSFGFTPLLLAAEEGHVEVIVSLLENGADVNVQNLYGNTALHYAISGGFDDVVAILIQHAINFRISNAEGKTPFMLIQKQDTLLTLWELKVILDNHGEYGLLHSAVDNGYVEALCRMIGKEGRVDVDATDEGGFTPLMMSVNKGRVDLVELLYSNGADINASSKKGWTPVMLAAKNDNHKMISLLMQNGAVISGSAMTNVIDHEEKGAYNVESDIFNIAPTDELCSYILTELEDNLSINPDPRIPLHGLIVRHRWSLLKYCLNKKIATDQNGVVIMLDALHQDVSCVMPYEQTYKRLNRNVIKSLWDFGNEELLNTLPIKVWIAHHMNEYGYAVLWAKIILYLIFLLLLGFIFLYPLHDYGDGIQSQLHLQNLHLIAEILIGLFWICFILLTAMKFIYIYKRYWDILIMECSFPQVGRYVNRITLTVSGLLILIPSQFLKAFFYTPVKHFRGRSRYKRQKSWDSFWRDFLMQLAMIPLLAYRNQEELRVDFLTDPRGKKVGKPRILVAHLYLRCFVLVTAIIKYFLNIYNSLSFGTYLCLFCYFIVRFAGTNEWWVFASLAFLMASLNILQYLTISFMGVYIYSVYRILKVDLLNFILLFSIVLIAFTGTFFIVIKGPFMASNSSMLMSGMCEGVSPLDSWYDVLFNGIRILTEQNNVLECAFFNSFINGLAVLILALFLFITLVILINVFIAQLVSTYSTSGIPAHLSFVTRQLDFIMEIQVYSILSLFDWRKYCFVKSISISKDQLKEIYPQEYKDIYREEERIYEMFANVNGKIEQLQLLQKDYFSQMANENQKLLDDHALGLKRYFIDSQKSIEIELKRQSDFLEGEFKNLVQSFKS